MKDVDYKSGKAPPDYRCSACGAHGCKLWRPTHGTELRCVACAEQVAKERFDVYARSGVDQIGWWLPAVPDEEGVSFWGYTSVPTDGVAWWKSLPMALPQPGATDADVAREFFRRFGPVKVLVGTWGKAVAYAESDGASSSSEWLSGMSDEHDMVEEHAAGEDGFAAALERAQQLVRGGR